MFPVNHWSFTGLTLESYWKQYEKVAKQ